MIQDDSEAWDEREKFFANMDDTAQSWIAAGTAIKKTPIRVRREYLVEDLIDRASLNVIYGPPKSCKTLVGQSMAHNLSTSKYWCNHRIIRPCNILYLGYEDPESLKLRQAALAQHDQQAFDENIGFMSIVSENIPEITSYLAIETIKCYFSLLVDNGPDIETNSVLFIDTLNMAFSHLGNENDAQFMAQVAKFARALCEIGITVFIIHHSGKDASKGLRGHTALSGAVDNVFHCKLKGKDKVEMTQEMWRNGPKGKKISFSIKEFDVACIAPNGVREMSCPIALFGSEEISPTLSLNPSEVIFLKAIRDSAIEDVKFYVAELGLPNDAQPARLSNVIQHAVDDKIAPNAKSFKSAARTATRAKEKLLERGLIQEKNGFVWKL